MSEQTPTIQLTIDGRNVTVSKGTTVYNAAKQLGIDIPIFCYHDRMPPFGACRMCLVEVEKAPKLQASCTLEATDGMVVKTQSSSATQGRQEILEFLLLNHPLDCPICDRGGECPLQEHVFHHGPGESRFCEEKRHFKKPLPLGPVLMLDRERCILCARCTRFSEIVSGDHALQLIDRGYRSEVGTPDQGPAASKFIGNTIMICPVGALTSQVYRFRARPWDNDPTPSTCTLCPIGCSLTFDARDGELMRTRSRENKNVNDIWLCDKGWFGYEFTDAQERLSQPLIRRNGALQPASWDEALTLVASRLQAANKERVAALGGNPLTVEESYLLQELMRTHLGVPHVDHRVGMPIHSLADEGIPPGMEMAIGACEGLDWVILAGVDLTEEFPVLWLRLRQAINRGAKVVFIGHFAPEIAPYLTNVITHAPGREVEVLQQQLSHLSDYAAKSPRGAIFLGRQYLDTEQRKTLLSMLWQWRRDSGVPHLPINLLEGRGNSLGARLAGMHPEVGPLGERRADPGMDARQVLDNAAKSGWDLLYVAGANPAALFPSQLWQQVRAKLGFLVVQDIFLTATAQQADVVLPALSFVEKGGHFVNIEGRFQGLLPGKEIPAGLYSDGEILALLAQKLGYTLTLPVAFKEVIKKELYSWPRHELSTPQVIDSQASDSQLRATFAPVLFDGGVRMQHNPHVSQLAPKPLVRLHPDEALRRSLSDGASIQLSAGGQTIRAEITCDNKVALGTIVLPLGFETLPLKEFGAHWINGLPIDIQA